MLLAVEEAVLTQTLILLLLTPNFWIAKRFDAQFALFYNSSPESKFTYICLRLIVNRRADTQADRHIDKQINTKKKKSKKTRLLSKLVPQIQSICIFH